MSLPTPSSPLDQRDPKNPPSSPIEIHRAFLGTVSYSGENSASGLACFGS